MRVIPPLKAFRENQKPPLSQERLAKLLDVDRVTVARWETGTRKIGGRRLHQVSKLTGIPKSALRPDIAVLMGEAAE